MGLGNKTGKLCFGRKMNINDHLRRDIHLVNKASACGLGGFKGSNVATSKTRVKSRLELRVKPTRHMNGPMSALKFIFAGRGKRCIFSSSILLSGESIARLLGREPERRGKRDRVQSLGASSLSTAQWRERRAGWPGWRQITVRFACGGEKLRKSKRAIGEFDVTPHSLHPPSAFMAIQKSKTIIAFEEENDGADDPESWILENG